MYLVKLYITVPINTMNMKKGMQQTFAIMIYAIIT